MAPSKVVISCPVVLDSTQLARGFAEQIRTASNATLLLLDFKHLRFATPFPALLTAQTIREIVSRRHSKGLETQILRDGVTDGSRSSAVDYLGHVGFFEYCGVGFGNQPGEARGSATYLPITVLRRPDLESKYPGQRIQEAVTQKCRRLAALLSADDSEQDVMMYCFREIVRNVFEHAETNQCTLMAQRYTGHVVEVAIVDEGIGVPASLSKAHTFKGAEAALRAAISPGISSILNGRTDDEWSNTGYGLYVAAELGRAAGSFGILSGNTLLSITGSGERVVPFNLRGTAVRLTVSTADAEFFSNRLNRIVTEGERLAALQPGAIRPASLRTRL